MLNITCILRDGERVVISWYGARPVYEDLVKFLESQYPGANISIKGDLFMLVLITESTNLF